MRLGRLYHRECARLLGGEPMSEVKMPRDSDRLDCLEDAAGHVELTGPPLDPTRGGLIDAALRRRIDVSRLCRQAGGLAYALSTTVLLGEAGRQPYKVSSCDLVGRAEEARRLLGMVSELLAEGS
jgi:hypothetical protein